MDERRFEELKAKRLSKGLTDEEADELGRMLAEQAGKPYSNAKHSSPDIEDPGNPTSDAPRASGN